MKLLAITIIEALWLFSIFSFARWRLATSAEKNKSGHVSNDLIFQVYLKVSGLGILVWIGSLLTKGI